MTTLLRSSEKASSCLTGVVLSPGNPGAAFAEREILTSGDCLPPVEAGQFVFEEAP